MVNNFWQSVDAILEDGFCDWSNCFDAINLIKDYHLSMFQKLRHSDTCNYRLNLAPNISDSISLTENLA